MRILPRVNNLQNLGVTSNVLEIYMLLLLVVEIADNGILT